MINKTQTDRLFNEFLKAFIVTLFIACCLALTLTPDHTLFFRYFFESALPIFLVGIPLHLYAIHHKIIEKSQYVIWGSICGLLAVIATYGHRLIMYGEIGYESTISAVTGIALTALYYVGMTSMYGLTFWGLLVSNKYEERQPILILWLMFLIPVFALKAFFYALSMRVG